MTRHPNARLYAALVREAYATPTEKLVGWNAATGRIDLRRIDRRDAQLLRMMMRINRRALRTRGEGTTQAPVWDDAHIPRAERPMAFGWIPAAYAGGIEWPAESRVYSRRAVSR